MKIDMHYHGTYALARAAGMQRDKAQIVATAAQFVDDNAHKQSILLVDGASVNSQATAHHAVDIKNIDREDQRLVWIPFHFLPGNEGGKYTQKLICRKDTQFVRNMIQRTIEFTMETRFDLELLGITAHAYEDTFSHYGFSGVSSRQNRVNNASIRLHGINRTVKDTIENKTAAFFKRYGKYGGLLTNIKRWIVSYSGETLSGALGHGAVATYPDLPYLHWSYVREVDNSKIERKNHKAYLLACKRVHQMFREFLEMKPKHAVDDGVEFTAIEDRIRDILTTQADKEGRIEAWKKAAANGDLFCGQDKDIPNYTPWHDEWPRWSFEDSSKVISSPLYRYFQAASTFRNFLLRRLLPEAGLLIK